MLYEGQKLALEEFHVEVYRLFILTSNVLGAVDGMES